MWKNAHVNIQAQVTSSSKCSLFLFIFKNLFKTFLCFHLCSGWRCKYSILYYAFMQCKMQFTTLTFAIFSLPTKHWILKKLKKCTSLLLILQFFSLIHIVIIIIALVLGVRIGNMLILQCKSFFLGSAFSYNFFQLLRKR